MNTAMLQKHSSCETIATMFRGAEGQSSGKNSNKAVSGATLVSSVIDFPESLLHARLVFIPALTPPYPDQCKGQWFPHRETKAQRGALTGGPGLWWAIG